MQLASYVACLVCCFKREFCRQYYYGVLCFILKVQMWYSWYGPLVKCVNCNLASMPPLRLRTYTYIPCMCVHVVHCSLSLSLSLSLCVSLSSSPFRNSNKLMNYRLTRDAATGKYYIHQHTMFPNIQLLLAYYKTTPINAEVNTLLLYPVTPPDPRQQQQQREEDGEDAYVIMERRK